MGNFIPENPLWKNLPPDIIRLIYQDSIEVYYICCLIHRRWGLESTNPLFQSKIKDMFTVCHQGEYFLNGKRHREYDRPAVEKSNLLEFENRTVLQMWYRHGKLHRDPEGDQPAIINFNITQTPSNRRFSRFERHRGSHEENEKPLIKYLDGTLEWWSHGIRHRENDKPAVIYGNGLDENPQTMCDDPERTNPCEWWYNGTLHRSGNNPAAKCPDGSLMFYEHGKNLQFRRGGQRIRASLTDYYYSRGGTRYTPPQKFTGYRYSFG